MEDFSTLLLGETGTGKGTAAAAIGRAGWIPFDEMSGRFAESFTRAFMAVNLSQLSELLIESELFGHRKGAFTGAFDDHEGVLAHCSPHGAIIERGELSAAQLLGAYCARLHERFGSIAEVARTTELDRRTVKKYIERQIAEG